MTKQERWNESKTKSFIHSYLHKPALWDTSTTEYSQKTEKLKAYEALMEEFGLTINEVRNKIRIYRTTYMQEKNKEATIPNYCPRLTWYKEMKECFKEGLVKSFAKKSIQGRSFIKRESMKEHPSSPDIQYEYVETEGEIDESNDVKTEALPTHIIIEPYEEDDQEEEHLELLRDSSINKTKDPQSPETKSPQETSLLSSNELFLQSLKSSLDRLPDEKNMRARIKIQEVLYTIMYEKP